MPWGDPVPPDPYGYKWQTWTSNRTVIYEQSLIEEDVRRIVREEMAEAPFKVDVPDGPPEA